MNKLITILRRMFFVVAIFCVVAVGLMTIPQKYQQFEGFQRKRDALRAQIAEKEAEIKSLKEKQRRFLQDSSFVERVARENHRVQAGELVFVFDGRK
ncbi:MAG: septum formation initiator family protein [Kiritimatiellae bacterium]|nr:septum formation initiator family protein [Kiritimatiellia bacterium]